MKEWQRDQAAAFTQFYKKQGEQPDLVIPLTVRIARENRRLEDLRRQEALAQKTVKADNGKERITDNNGKDLNFTKPNTDKMNDPFFVKTRNSI